MGKSNGKSRSFFHGDNLTFLRAMNSESVDLIATDPLSIKVGTSMLLLILLPREHPFKIAGRGKKMFTRTELINWRMIFPKS